MAAPGTAQPGVAMPLLQPLPRSYQTHYALAANDPLGGDYSSVMNVMTTGGATPYTAAQILLSMTATPVSFPNGVLGMFEAPGYPGGLSLLLSGIRSVPTIPGASSPWQGLMFAFVGDVIDDEIPPTAQFPDNALEAANGGNPITVPGSLARVDELLAVDPTHALIGPFDRATEVGSVNLNTRRCMYIPPKYIPLVAGRRLTPRQLWTDVVGAIRANNDTANCKELVNWVLVSLIATTTSATPTTHLKLSAPLLPLPDTELVRYRKEVLRAQISGLAHPAITDTHAAATHQLTTFVGQLIEEQRQNRADERDRADEKRAATKPSVFWGEDLCRTLCTLCGVTTEQQLPELWLALAANGKSKDRSVLENLLQSTARDIGLRSSAPLATPDLTKKLVHLRFAGDNIDDLSDGVQPFVLTIQDHGAIGFSTQQDTQRVRQQNEEYDLLATENVSTTLADARTIRTTSSAKIPASYDHMQVMFQAFQVLLHAMLGAQHPVVQAYKSFTSAYFDEMLYYQGRLKALDVAHAPARLMRFVQLRIINWFREIRSTNIMPPPPDFRSALSCMDRAEAAWIPDLPNEYRVPQLSKPPASIVPSPTPLGSAPPSMIGTGTSSGSVGDVSQLPSMAASGTTKTDNRTQVHNTKRNSVFQPYVQHINRTKLKDSVTKAGPPPTVNRNNSDVQMCLSYHLRGSCFTNCRRSRDHQEHSTDEDALLVQWCNTAYAATA